MRGKDGIVKRNQITLKKEESILDYALDGICFDKLNAILQQTFTYIINGLSFVQSNINMGRRHFIHMEPGTPPTP